MISKKCEPLTVETERTASQVVDLAIRVHRSWGREPGVCYEIFLCHELAQNRIPFQRQIEVPVIYDDIELDAALRLDVLIDDCVIVELKSVKKDDSAV